jgi:hypothetical protein
LAFFTLSAFSHDSVESVWTEMEQGSPRARVLVSASFVESHLEHLLRSRLAADKKVLSKAFENSNGALRSFSSKIDIGYLMSQYSAEAHKELHTIRDIRNDFAHKLEISANTPSVKDRCKNLTLSSKLKITIKNAENKNAIVDVDFSADASDAMGRFQQTCRFYIAIFTVMISHPKNGLKI